MLVYGRRMNQKRINLLLFLFPTITIWTSISIQGKLPHTSHAHPNTREQSKHEPAIHIIDAPPILLILIPQ